MDLVAVIRSAQARWWQSVALVAVLVVAMHQALHAETAGKAESLNQIESSKDYVDLAGVDGIAIDLRYATTNNFVGENLYGSFNRAFLRRTAAEKLSRAVENLRKVNPKYRFVIFDALRPRSVQTILWDKVKGTDRQKYVANPKSGSIHNFGFAVDLSVLDEDGRELDMGTPFDAFTPLAEPRKEREFAAEEKLTTAQLKNRKILRRAMEEAGFHQLPDEWWHFDALPASEVRGKYQIVE